MRLKWIAAGTGVVVLVVASVFAVTRVPSAHGSPARSDARVPAYNHIFYVMMENHSYDEVIGNSNAPQINQLAQKYGLATDYFGVTHPSEPNYVAAIGGSFFGIQDDGPYTTHTINAPSLASQLEAKGLTWKTYQQSLPYAGFTGTAFPSSSIALYASKHNPFLNFASIQNSPAELAKIVPDTQLYVDLLEATVPNFSFIVPDQCHDMHGTSACPDDTQNTQVADQYVSALVGAIQHSDTWDRGNNAIVIVWDENDFSTDNPNGCCDGLPGGGHVPAIVITNHGPHHVQDNTPFNHYSLLQTIQEAFRLDCLQNTCDTANVTPMTKLFQNGDQ
jgi:phosphatidylinositol-3-phosphatase